jgi:hypothetical protein
MFFVKVIEKTETHDLCSITFFSFENRAVYELMSTNMVDPEGSHMTSQYGAYELHAGLARLHARTRMYTPTRPGTRMYACARVHTHKYVIFIAFTRQQGFVNAPYCYVIRTLRVLFKRINRRTTVTKVIVVIVQLFVWDS